MSRPLDEFIARLTERMRADALEFVRREVALGYHLYSQDPRLRTVPNQAIADAVLSVLLVVFKRLAEDLHHVMLHPDPTADPDELGRTAKLFNEAVALLRLGESLTP